MTQQGTGRIPSVAGSGASPLPIVMYGAAACEDTAITRSRLVAMGIPFRDLDIDLDPEAARAQLVANAGRRATPTLVFGAGQLVVVEPTLERLGEALAAAGHAAEPPEAIACQDETASRPIPLRRLPTADGEELSIAEIRGQRQAALFLGHDAGCLACFGYAMQLAAQWKALDDVESIPIVVVAGTAGAAATWRHGIADGVPILADIDGSWKRAVARRMGTGAEGTILLMLDRLASPRAASIAAEAGGLVDPSVATNRLRRLALERPGESTKEQPHG